MKLKLDENGNAVVVDGKPVYVHADGKEIPFDAERTVARIGELNNESKTHRERAEAAEATLKGFEGITDPALALKALQTVKNLDDKKLVDAGEVENIRSQAIKATEEKFAPIVAERDTLQNRLVEEKIGGSFARSGFINDKLMVPADMAQATFGQHFKLEDNSVVAYDAKGSRIFSRENPGVPAQFDEALEIIVAQYPHRDRILKGSGASGGGARGGAAGSGGANNLNRTAFDALPPMQQAAHIKAGGGVTD